jgi:hypothetical protein
METPQLKVGRMVLAEQAQRTFVVTTEQGHTKENLLNPNYWTHFAREFQPYDEIKVRCDDESYYGTLLVVACDRTWAKVVALNWISIGEDVKVPETDEYELKFGGPYLLWRVIRKKDGGVLKEKCRTKKEAADWMHDYIKTAGKAAA